MRASRRLATGVAALCLTATACGTTVPLAEQTQGASGQGLSGTAGTTGLGSSPVGGTRSDGPVVGGRSTGTTGTGSGTTGSAAGTTTGALPSTGPVQPGTTTASGNVSHAPIKLGALTATGAAKYQKSLGVSGATGDQTAMTKAVVDDINAHGGIGGRRIELLTYDLDAGAFSANPSQATLAACTYFTQDHRVAALASYVALVPESFYACLAKAHLPVVSPDEGASADFFRRYVNSLYMPSTPNYTRLLADSVDALWQAGWLTGSSHVGVVSYDTTDSHAVVDKGLVPALKRHGLALDASLYTAADTSGASDYNGGVLKFKTQGIDRVFFAPGGQPYYFALAASSQGYRPHYALNSLEYPTTLSDNLPASQLSGSMGLGWSPYFDLPSTAWASVTTPGITRCRTAMRSAAQDFSSGTTLGIAAWICDEWYFLRDALASATGTDDVSFRQSAEALGSTFRSASTFRTSLAPGRTHDGATAYRLLAFDDGCSCYRYRTAVRPLP